MTMGNVRLKGCSGSSTETPTYQWAGGGVEICFGGDVAFYLFPTEKPF